MKSLLKFQSKSCLLKYPIKIFFKPKQIIEKLIEILISENIKLAEVLQLINKLNKWIRILPR